MVPGVHVLQLVGVKVLSRGFDLSVDHLQEEEDNAPVVLSKNDRATIKGELHII